MLHLSPVPALALAICASLALPTVTSRQLILAVDPSATTGALTRVDTAPPFPATPLAAAASHRSVVHVFDGRLYVLGRDDRTVQVRALPGLALLQQFALPQEVKTPRDVALVGATMLLISDHDQKNLWWLDTATGVLSAGQDLSAYADGDGLPDVARMLVVGPRVVVQMQRYERGSNAERGAKLAVLAPGFNPDPPVILESVIDLQGTRPDHPMQLDKSGTRLWVSACGRLMHEDGGAVPAGIEEVDLAAGVSLGFLFSEAQLTADLGPFVMIDDDRGFAIGHTSIGASTHLHAFRRTVGHLAELHATVSGIYDTIAYDDTRRTVFYPVGELLQSPSGVLAFDADTWQQLSPMTIATGGAPFDMVVGP